MSGKEKKLSELATVAQKSVKTLRAWIKNGLEVTDDKGATVRVRLAAEKRGRDYFVNPETLEKYIHTTGIGNSN